MTQGDAASVDGVRVRVEGAVGHLTLDRPRALNALDIGMVARLRAALESWRDDADVRTIVLDGAGERGFCAGGDVRSLYDRIAGGDARGASVFFRDEYALDAAIAEYPKPVVALADGITMGGGVGLACHAALRIVTERSRLAMPETRIGFTPDVGGSLLLARAPGRLGEHLALTGETMDAADAIAAGFADHFVPHDMLPRLTAALAAGVPAADAVREVAEVPPPSRLAAARAWIDEAYVAASVPEILALLDAQTDPDATAAAVTLRALSPTALTVALAAIRRARELPGLRDALAQEYGLVLWFAETQPDLVEGIRAQLVDKDRSPRWRPADLAEVPADIAEHAFAFTPAVPLWP